MPQTWRKGSPGLVSHIVWFTSWQEQASSGAARICALLLSLSENKKALRPVGGRPTDSLGAVPRAGLSFRTQGTPGWLSWRIPLPESRQLPWQRLEIPEPQWEERGSAGGRGGNRGSQSLPGSLAGGRLNTGWTPFSARPFCFLLTA